MLFVLHPREDEPTDFELTVCIDEQVTRFQISVQDVRRVNILQDPVRNGQHVGMRFKSAVSVDLP